MGAALATSWTFLPAWLYVFPAPVNSNWAHCDWHLVFNQFKCIHIWMYTSFWNLSFISLLLSSMSKLQLPENWFNLDFTIKYLVNTICCALYWVWEGIINTYLNNTMTLKARCCDTRFYLLQLFFKVFFLLD